VEEGKRELAGAIGLKSKGGNPRGRERERKRRGARRGTFLRGWEEIWGPKLSGNKSMVK